MLRIVGFALASLIVVPASSAAAASPVPTEAEARLAISAYDRGAWRYDGVVTGAPVSGRLAMSITEAPDGAIGGEALLLTPDRRLLAASSVSGQAAGTTCRLDFALESRTERLDGICSPQVIGGRIVASGPKLDLVMRIVFWWGDQDIEGEAWLAPATGL